MRKPGNDMATRLPEGGIFYSVPLLARLSWTLTCSGLIALAGCANKGGAKANEDPLLGPPGPLPPAAQAAKAPPQPGFATTSNPVAPPPPPAVGSSPSNAALASGSVSSMRIPDPRTPPWQDTGSGAKLNSIPQGGAQALPTNPNPPFNPVLAYPVPGQTSTPATAAGGRFSSYEQAQAVLNQRGVIWQKLETWGDLGEWKFSCSIPNKQNRFISRTYEARGKDYLSAIRSVMDQIEKEQ